MRLILTAILLAAFALPAHAISRINSKSLNCADIQAIIKGEGAVILRYPSRRVRGLTLFNRYVSNPRFCESNKYAVYGSVPARDNAACRVQYCREKMDQMGN